MAHHHLQGSGFGNLGCQLLQKGLGKGFPRREQQNRWHGLARGAGAGAEQKAVGRGAALEAVLHFKAQPAGAQAP